MTNNANNETVCIAWRKEDMMMIMMIKMMMVMMMKRTEIVC